MLSLGIKEAVINNFSDWKVSFTLGTAASTAELGDTMHIEGFGSFKGANLTAGAGSAARKIDAVNEVAVVDLSATTTVDTIYVAQIFVRTTRYQSEFANDFIKQGRPIVVEWVGAGGTFGAEIEASIDLRNARFAIGEATPFVMDATTPSATTLTVTHPSLHIEKFLYRAKSDLLDTSVAVVADGSGGSTVGTEGQGNGSQVEESVRMGFGENVNPYGIKAGTNVDVQGAYSEIFWKVDIPVAEKVGYVLDSTNARQVSFDVFANENGNLAADGPIDDILTFLLTNGAITVAGAAQPQLGVYLPDGTNAVNTAGTVAEAVTDFISA